MIVKIKRILRGKLNKSGFALIEVFLSFIVLITTAVLLLNSFSTKADMFASSYYAEDDYFESLKAISKAVYFTGSEDSFDVILDGYLPHVNLTDPTTIDLISNTDELSDGSININTAGKGYDLMSRTVIGDARIYVTRDESLNTGEIMVTLESYDNGEFDTVPLNNLTVVSRSTVSPSLTGPVLSLPDEFITNNVDINEFNTLLVPIEGTETEVLTYEKIY